MDIPRNRVVGQCLRALRLNAGLTQVEIAARLKKTQSFVSKVENAERELSLIEVFTYAEALGIGHEKIIAAVYAGLADAGLCAPRQD